MSGEYTVTAFWNNNIATVIFELTGISGSNVFQLRQLHATSAPADTQCSLVWMMNP